MPRVCGYIADEDVIIDYARKTRCRGIVDGVETEPNFDTAVHFFMEDAGFSNQYQLEAIIVDGDVKLLLAIASTDPLKGLPRRPKDEKILRLKQQLNETSRPKWYFEASREICIYSSHQHHVS
ncbi:hypothetical protein B0H11DRAFT_2214921 [Mycena galericulata]|nr:hypothetical protein B0H11DRAFT_2214921 [Mycena galericulata]